MIPVSLRKAVDQVPPAAADEIARYLRSVDFGSVLDAHAYCLDCDGGVAIDSVDISGEREFEKVIAEFERRAMESRG